MINKVQWLNLVDVTDSRGRLTAFESGDDNSFIMKRIFFVHQVKEGVPRGGHAHKYTDQLLIAICGSLSVVLSDGRLTKRYNLNDPAKGLFVPQSLWIKLVDFSQDCACAVIANTIYNKNDSLREWNEYLKYYNIPKCVEP